MSAPTAITVRAFCALTMISRDAVERMIARGDLKVIRFGNRLRRIPITELDRLGIPVPADLPATLEQLGVGIPADATSTKEGR
ncbi:MULTISPECIES: excisionase family DNA-binding protein [Actinomyces]|uniref:excisionase family DNA-binding protein n=1 Tax=Actinomyces TaxID=1654 RepID=UPI001114CD20|nr:MULTISPECIES: excisionase family DNA-binding protein [Actinomyces]